MHTRKTTLKEKSYLWFATHMSVLNIHFRNEPVAENMPIQVTKALK